MRSRLCRTGCATLDRRPKKVRFERMSDILTPLILDFLAWLEATPRPYAEVMDVWRTSCPRLTIWEDAVDAGLVVHLRAPGEPATVGVTDKGRQMLEARSKGVALSVGIPA
jgi:hypothetical protein